MTDINPDKAVLILDEVLRHAAFDGWTDLTVSKALASLDLPEGAEHIYTPKGALGLIRLWSDQLDAQIADDLRTLDLGNMRVRDKITEAVWMRLNLLADHPEAARRALSRLALPDGAGQAATQLWSSADMIWTAIGDVSEDYNYYTKRTILSGVIGSSLMAWLSDETDNKSQARAFLERRIGDVMTFEKFKGQTLGAGLNALSALPRPNEILDLIGKPRRRSKFQRRRYNR